MMSVPATFLFLFGMLFSVESLDNGLGLTPPMGWLSWLRFGCTIDCDKQPTECISEKLIMRTADSMVNEGYLAAGYEYITIDDCWQEKQRGPDGRLVPDRKRFPNGIKALAEYVHKKGLKFGIYEDYGTSTCAGYPGVQGHEKIDADTLASWDIDYLKLDGCHTDIYKMNEAYTEFGRLLNVTGRPILYACSYPFFQEVNNVQPNYSEVAKHCNIWRNYYDISNSWESVLNTMTWFGMNQDRIAPYTGPGHFSDPDVLVVGNSGLTVDQAQVQMAVWAILAAPLIMSVDLASIKPEFKAILLNPDVIAVSRDKLGQQGLRVWKGSIFSKRRKLEVWSRKLSGNSYAIAFVNRGEKETTASFTHKEMKLPQLDYLIEDLFTKENDISLKAKDSFAVHINKTGVRLFKFYPETSSNISVVLVNKN